MDIIHLSDLHFGNDHAPFNERELSDGLSKYIVNQTENPIVILSGDITIQGKKEGYLIATTFVDNLLSAGQVSRNHLCFCPGNHDIVEGGFKSFDTFVYGARRDRQLDFDNGSCKILEIQDTVFVILNSSFHLDHRYGLIEEGSLNVDLSQYDKDKKRVLIFHHHILNQFDDDTSAIRNSYDLVQFIEKNEFCLVLHGHQHTEQHYHVGKKATPVVSARSSNFSQLGYLNAFNHYKITDEDISFESLVFERSSKGICIKNLGRQF